MDDRLDRLWAEYRAACPDPDPGANFMPQLWKRIEARRGATASLLLRRWAEAWLVATLALALAMGAFLIPSMQAPAYQATYLDVLAAADSANDLAVIPVVENE